jgi:hypothetical protein
MMTKTEQKNKNRLGFPSKNIKGQREMFYLLSFFLKRHPGLLLFTQKLKRFPEALIKTAVLSSIVKPQKEKEPGPRLASSSYSWSWLYSK